MVCLLNDPRHTQIREHVTDIVGRDLSRYQVDDITPADAANAHCQCAVTGPGFSEGYISEGRTLWYAIREVGSTAWVEEGLYVPPTDKWKQWLAEAQKAVDEGNRDWPAVKREDEIMQYGVEARP